MASSISPESFLAGQVIATLSPALRYGGIIIAMDYGKCKYAD